MSVLFVCEDNGGGHATIVELGGYREWWTYTKALRPESAKRIKALFNKKYFKSRFLTSACLASPSTRR